MVKINDIAFSDIYIAHNKLPYIYDGKTQNGLKPLEAEDFEQFYTAISAKYDGKNPSYSLLYEGIFYRIERTLGIYGTQYCGRKMPKQVPAFATLGFSANLTRHLLSLSNASGLILWSGPTGAGKTTAISSLLKEYLTIEGGYAFTIEDPSEMPLDGVYKSLKGGIGVCSQTQPTNDDWGASLKSALRSKPRFIMVGEIRTPETASEVLRAATSGHLVLSSIHANNVTDAINSVVKYAAATSMSEELAYDLFSRGVLAVMHQHLIHEQGVAKPELSYLLTNPDTTAGDQVRGIIKTGKLNLATSIETQMTRMQKGIQLFPKI